ncbi:non-homologous end joining protein Ku [Longimycelium tulufanense]|uniref:Non-homologous end joining protein Ku n=1 Tax=Longimycelium tulufanense TaxID=907463 RepID=A0A8J3FY38_9PSEU|nr:Ku protein [Longimycelium tulufanense]GGM78905.1 non-homologous end joining protein Ku [Longimycelium tulufanense]
MRAMWRGAISFGLVTIGVRLFAATEEHDFRFHQVHRADGGRIRYKRVCSLDGEEVEYADIAKGHELEDGRMVILDQEDFDKLPISTDRAIEVLEFVPAEQIDPLYFQRAYYLEPEKNAVRPYVLLRQALQRADQLAVVKITLRQRETLATVRAREDVLVLHTMLWPDEIRAPEFGFLEGDTTVRPQELAMAESLIENMAGDFDPEEFSDDYREAMAELIEAKAEGAELPERAEPEPAGEVIDLMTALERSVEAARSSRGGGRAAGGRSGAKAGGQRRATSRSTGAAKSTKTAGTAAKTTKAGEKTGGKTAGRAKSGQRRTGGRKRPA